MEGADGFVPSRAGVPDVVSFVVEHHNAAMAGDSVPQGCPRIQGFGFGNRRPHPAIAIIGGFLAAFFVEAVNVGEVKGAAGSCAAGFILQNDGEIPIPSPFGGDEGIAVKDAPVAKVVFEAFVDGEVGGDDHKVPRHF